MAQFYGSAQGRGKNAATQLGNKSTGLTTVAAGWKGAITVSLHSDDEGNDYYTVYLGPWQGSGGETTHIASGRLDAAKPYGDTDE